MRPIEVLDTQRYHNCVMNDHHSYLDTRLVELKHADSESLYYVFTLTADNSDNIVWATQTMFTGWHDHKKLIELRKPRLVYPSFAEFWEHFNQPYVVINDPQDLPLFLMAGGNSLIKQHIVKQHLAEFLAPDPSVRDSYLGFKSLTCCDPNSFQRSPTPKLRMQALKRDDRRCRVCGRRPDDYVDVELHVHHIRPWANGGLTELSNLITLCHTCHKGLDPHEDLSLYEYITSRSRSTSAQAKLTHLFEGIARYRKIIYGMIIPKDEDT